MGGSGDPVRLLSVHYDGAGLYLDDSRYVAAKSRASVHVLALIEIYGLR